MRTPSNGPTKAEVIDGSGPVGSPRLSGLRVAMVTPDYPPDVIGGAGVSCHLLVRQLRGRGLRVDVYALTGGRCAEASSPDGEKGSCIRLSAAGGRVGRNLRAFGALRRRLSEYDILHVYDASLLPAAAMLHCLGRPRVAVVMHLNNLQGACFTPELCLKERCERHGWLKSMRCAVVDPEPTSRMRRLLLVHPIFHVVNRLGRLVPNLIALSADLKARYVAAGLPARRIVVVPNMLDERLFPPRETTRTGNSPAELTVLCVGQLDHRKGVHELLAAYGQLPAEVRAKTRLTVLGAGKEERGLRELIDRCGIDDRVAIRHCPYGNLPDEYAAADLFVKPACWPEPFGRTCLEALAFGLPVLAADVPSAREVLGGSAVYYRPFDVDDLAANLRQIIESDELRRGTGSGATDRLSRYRPSMVVNAILDVYESCFWTGE